MLTLAALVLGALALPGAAPAASQAEIQRDAATLRQAVDGAARTGALDAAPASSYRTSIAAALGVLDALDSPAKRSRHDELAAQLDQLAGLTGRGDLTAERMPAAFHQLDANRIWFASHP